MMSFKGEIISRGIENRKERLVNSGDVANFLELGFYSKEIVSGWENYTVYEEKTVVLSRVDNLDNGDAEEVLLILTGKHAVNFLKFLFNTYKTKAEEYKDKMEDTFSALKECSGEIEK